MFNIFKNSASSILSSSPSDDVRYFPKDFPSDNILNGNFPNVNFPKGQFPKGQVRPFEAAQAAMGQGVERCGQDELGGQALQLEQAGDHVLRLKQTWEVPAW